MNQIDTVYAAIIPEHERWQEMESRSLPTTCWVNTQRTSVGIVAKSLLDQGAQVEFIPWSPCALKVSGITLGKTPEYLLGLLQIQEEVSMMPVHFLAPKPGEKILDMCAAPGNKSAQIAMQMRNQGTLVSNDKNYQRMKAFGQISRRLGLVNVSLSVQDGRYLSNDFGQFDAVLVDAPCSGEGTFRKRRNKHITPNEKNSRRLSAIQIGLLKKAIHLCRDGGRIVYSTCTFSPIENEFVVQSVLNHFGADIELLPARIPGLVNTPGVQAWGDVIFDASLHKTLRLWPHLNDTGGFYVAVIKKHGLRQHSRAPVSFDQGVKTSSKAEIVEYSQESIQPYLAELIQRFGFAQALFDPYTFLNRGRGIYMTATSTLSFPDHLVDASGLFFMKTKTRFPKMTTAATYLFGGFAKKNVIELRAEQCALYFEQKDISLTERQVRLCTGTGYVILMHDRLVIGMGLYFEHHLVVRSLFPKWGSQG